MNEERTLLEADARRRAAMIEADVAALDAMLDDALIWTHSSGRTDDKRSFLDGIASGVVTYLALETDAVSVIRRGDVYVCHGLLNGRASRDGVEKALSNRFLAVWVREGDAFRLLAWQSTGL